MSAAHCPIRLPSTSTAERLPVHQATRMSIHAACPPPAGGPYLLADLDSRALDDPRRALRERSCVCARGVSGCAPSPHACRGLLARTPHRFLARLQARGDKRRPIVPAPAQMPCSGAGRQASTDPQVMRRKEPEDERNQAERVSQAIGLIRPLPGISVIRAWRRCAGRCVHAPRLKSRLRPGALGRPGLSTGRIGHRERTPHAERIDSQSARRASRTHNPVSFLLRDQLLE
jgi:hypothetical protein